MRRLTIDQARRIALGAQGFADPRPTGRVDVRHFRRVVDRIGLVQLDSVNVYSRTHYMPFFSRLGIYDRSALDAWLWGSGEMFEYWGHEASVIPVQDHNLWRWRMNGTFNWTRLETMRLEHPEYLDQVLEQVRDRGPLKTADLHDPGQRDGTSMWGWSKGKVALEALFMGGRVTTAHRPNFTRMYDLSERVVPGEHFDAQGLEREEAQSILLLKAARSMGVATAADLADYHRIRMPEARPLIERLSDDGAVVEVEVEGWGRAAYLHPEARLPRKVEGRALLSPFDNLVWYRDRVERLWDFHYRIEIYVPEPKRVYGYYVLPFLLDEALVARVDLKTDRKKGSLLVKGVFAEPGVDRARVARELRAELELTSSWLGLNDVVVSPNGDLADAVRSL
ncbi:MAG TPA: crosslink repair DNA glycosylase YcaQ family protein [Acidimicrobiia bacterium]|nr:crosslink repair DNA glycosylase YcaQ family protein [Acidimicrobiia bacterium]